MRDHSAEGSAESILQEGGHPRVEKGQGQEKQTTERVPQAGEYGTRTDTWGARGHCCHLIGR